MYLIFIKVRPHRSKCIVVANTVGTRREATRVPMPEEVLA